MKYLLSVAFIVAAVIIGNTLIPARAPAMGSTQFGTFSPGYLARKAERAEQRKNRPQPKPETQCWDFDKHDTPNGFANALENPVPCKDLVK